MKRIITSVKKVNLNNTKYKNVNTKRPLYEVSGIFDGEKKQITAYGDTEAFLEMLDDFDKYLDSCLDKLEQDAITHSEKNRWKYNLILFPIYILGLAGMSLSGQMPDGSNILSFLLGLLTFSSAVVVANGLTYYTKDIKKRKTGISQRKENLEKLKEKCQILIANREKRELLEKTKATIDSIAAKSNAWDQRVANYDALTEKLLRRNLPLEEQEKLKPTSSSTKSNFQPDYPPFVIQQMQRDKRKREIESGKYNKEYDVLERTGRKR